MPTWWGKKSSKSKNHHHHQDQPNGHGSVLQFNFIKGKKSDNKPKSFDEVTGAAFLSRNSPRASKDFTSPCGGAAVVDSDGGDKIGLPLPRPSVSSTHSFGNDQGLVFGSGSFSGSSVSSTGSFDDHSISQINATRLDYFYWLLAVLGVPNFILFLVLAMRHQYKVQPNIKPNDSEEKELVSANDVIIGINGKEEA